MSPTAARSPAPDTAQPSHVAAVVNGAVEDAADDQSSGLSEPEDDDGTAGHAINNDPGSPVHDLEVKTADTEPKKLDQLAVAEEHAEDPTEKPAEDPANSPTLVDGMENLNEVKTGQKRKRSIDHLSSPPRPHAEQSLDQDKPTQAASHNGGRKGKKGRQKGRKSAHNEVQTNQNEAEPDLLAGAAASFEQLMKQFVGFRRRIYDERLASMNEALSALSAPDCQHVEYQRQVVCVDARRERQVREAYAYYALRLQSIRRTTLGERAQLMCQYDQEVRDLRDRTLAELCRDSASLQRERRQQYQKDEQYLYKFPADRDAQLLRQAKYNHEVSVLSGMSKYVGFPAAPDVQGANDGQADEDMREINVTRRQQNSHPPGPFLAPMTAEERLAHEKYIEQNSWTRPQRPPSVLHSTPRLTHGALGPVAPGGRLWATV
ncbi:hypothetical protein K470DRAFT_259123 [Piedraia hortae CBS 480.64]|uniref:Transcriptional regulatory protein DEP1 n=1 Tax=Piedraia hortae CBS 480.64 TaxID=1314780 RepID=A0A6A7BV20_9PEZI|nr:hypothetical protein K470DRAFT_259123 [Piedraia hortae CBS 480.64]